MQKTILLLEDETSIAENVIYSLKAEGFNVIWQPLAEQGLIALQESPIDLLLLDVGLPDINGFELCKQIRTFSDVPIIFLTARSDEIDRVVGLEIGGDDYVVKPFSLRELMARVKVVIRRRSSQPSPQDMSQSVTVQQSALAPGDTSLTLNTEIANPFKVDLPRRQIHYLGQLLVLTLYEFGILQLLLSQPERVFSREQLMNHVWPAQQDSYERVVDTHIKSLRAKLKAVNPQDQSVVTHRGVGYCLKVDQS